MSEPAPDRPGPVRAPADGVDDAGEVASASAATSSGRAQAQAVHDLSEPERLDGSQGPV